MGSVQDYSPAELLQFGQRAEAEGDYDYALRAYAYLADHFSGSTEGQIAQDAHARVHKRMAGGHLASGAFSEAPIATGPSSNQPPSARPVANGQTHGPDTGVEHSQPFSTPQQPVTTGGRGASPQSPSSEFGQANTGIGQNDGQTTPPSQSVRQPQSDPRLVNRLADLHQHPQGAPRPSPVHLQPTKTSVSHSNAVEDDNTQLPRMMRAIEEVDGDLETAFRRKYRAAAFIAVCLTVIGWLLIVSGVALLAGTYVEAVPDLAASGLYFASFGIEAGLVALLAGILVVFVSQLGCAIFDNANATRQLLAIERAKAGY